MVHPDGDHRLPVHALGDATFVVVGMRTIRVDIFVPAAPVLYVTSRSFAGVFDWL